MANEHTEFEDALELIALDDEELSEAEGGVDPIGPGPITFPSLGL